MRIGLGYDVHRLIEGRALILGGVNIPYEKGLLGHSDADVLTHAVMDALLGAAALGDIGKHFPDTDPATMHTASGLLANHASTSTSAGRRADHFFHDPIEGRFIAFTAGRTDNPAPLYESAVSTVIAAIKSAPSFSD